MSDLIMDGSIGVGTRNTETVFRRLLQDAGRAQVYAMIGSPVGQVKSPDFFNRYFDEKGLHAKMVAIDVQPEQVEAFFSVMRAECSGRGCIVTVPHKGAAFLCMDEVSHRASLLKAVNVVYNEDGRLIGDMVDGMGFLVALKSRGFSIEGKRVALIGAGGAGAAIGQAIAQAGASELFVRDIDPERLVHMKRVIRETNPAVAISLQLKSLAHIDLAVNATPLGMNQDTRLPFPTDTLSPRTLVMDVVTQPKVTLWLWAALEKGCEVVYGAEMVYGQFGWLGRRMGLEIEDPSPGSEGIKGRRKMEEGKKYRDRDPDRN